MVGEFFVLLLFWGEPMQLKEYTIREGLSECLGAKRTIERNLRGGKSTTHQSSVLIKCGKYTVEYTDDYNIIKFIDGEPKLGR